MKIPNKVKIGAVTYSVEEVEFEKVSAVNIGQVLKTTMLEGNLAQIHFPNCEIKISKELKQDKKLFCLFHEIYHAHQIHYGLDSELNENACNLFATAVLQFINDNIEEIKWKE